ncbi:MAG: ABC transporter substrate-binding protein [Nanoarchaeota archaeon]|jgi:branched-chain amino acid transport system substrate-binding protein|nr:ABC transporter substrate-binding protein [Nanoarchaeota archaeon]
MKNKNTKIIVIASVLVAIIILAITLTSSNNVVEAKTVKIGVIGHFSGNYADYGLPMKNAVSLYVDEFNKNNEMQIQLIFEDDLTDANKAASAMNKLVNIDNVDYVLSAQGSGAASVIAPIAEDTGTILMVTLGSAPGIPQGKDYVFRSVVSDVYQGSAILNVIENKFNSKKVSVLYVNDAYGVGIKDYMLNGNFEKGIYETFESQSSDFKTQLLKIKESNSDTLALIARDKEIPTILRQIDDLGIDFKYIIISEIMTPEEVLSNTGLNSEGIYTISAKSPIDYVNFNEQYKEVYGEDLGYAMYAYDGAVALIKAIKSSNANAEVVKTKLHSVSFNGASGEVGFDLEGDRTGVSYEVYQVVNGKLVVV